MAVHTTSTETNRQLFTQLYQSVFPAVAKYISRRGGSLDEAKDVFQDAVVIWYEKTASAGHQLQNDKAYLMGIAKHLWIKSYQANQRYVPLDEISQSFSLTEITDSQPLSTMLLNYLETAGQKCMDLLKSFYYDKQSMGEIAESFGFSGERSATVQKFKCLEKVRETVKSKSLTYEDFVD